MVPCLALGFAAAFRRSASLLAQSIALLTTIRCNQGANGTATVEAVEGIDRGEKGILSDVLRRGGVMHDEVGGPMGTPPVAPYTRETFDRAACDPRCASRTSFLSPLSVPNHHLFRAGHLNLRSLPGRDGRSSPPAGTRRRGPGARAEARRRRTRCREEVLFCQFGAVPASHGRRRKGSFASCAKRRAAGTLAPHARTSGSAAWCWWNQIVTSGRSRLTIRLASRRLGLGERLRPRVLRASASADRFPGGREVAI